MPELYVICSDGRALNVPVTDNIMSVGRSADNAVVIKDNTVSRRHAQISKTEEGYKVTDLGSFNGITVNGISVQSAVLKNNDLIEIGTNKITFLSQQREKTHGGESIVLTAEEELSDAKPQHIIESQQAEESFASDLLMSSLENLQDGTSAMPSSLGSSQKSITDISSLERSNKVLFVLYEISKQLNVVQDFNKLLKKIMDLLFMVINADSGFLVLLDDEDITREEELIPVVVKYRNEKLADKEKLRASRTIISRVIKDKVALLTSNAMDDDRLDDAKSVFLQQIRSAMCVPLSSKDKIVGIIQLDSIKYEAQFTNDDLELLKAIASQMSMIIEQARLNEQIREEEQMRNRLERFHSPQVVEMILKGGQETKDNIMEPKDVTATILFTDIVGFTSLSESMPARDITMLLNQYFSRMTDVVFKYDGTLDKYIGDAIMAVFGVPIEKEGDAERAIRAALEMRTELDAMRDDKGERIPINIRLGINTGRVVAGNIGSPKRMEYTVMGDQVNVASRLESIAQSGQILIGENTYKLVKDKFKINKIGPKMVKGKTKEVVVYEILD